MCAHRGKRLPASGGGRPHCNQPCRPLILDLQRPELGEKTFVLEATQLRNFAEALANSYSASFFYLQLNSK